MAKAYVFYNPLSGGGRVLEDLDALEFLLDRPCVFCDMTKPETYGEALFAMGEKDLLVLCGGDGTLNCFVNLTREVNLPNEMAYYPAGDHNDFALDFGHRYGSNPFPVTKAIRSLPKVQMGNRTTCFLTGIVFQADSGIRRSSRRAGDYNEKNRPQTIKLKVDSGMYFYDKVQFAAVLTGCHCNGGLIPDPDRRRTDGDLSCVLIHDCGKRYAKYLLKQLRKGRRINSHCLTRHRGAQICLSFGSPVQIRTDGEVQSGITEVTACVSREGEE